MFKSQRIKTAERRTLLPDFNLRNELTDLLKNDDVKKQLVDTISKDSDLKMTDIDSHLQKIVDLLEPIISDRLTERLNQLQYQIFDVENRLDESERYNRSYSIRLLNAPYHKDEDAIQVTVDIANEIGCYLDYTQIETAHRIFQKPEISTSTKPPLPPVLIARFYCRPRCFALLSCKSVFRQLRNDHPMKNVIIFEDLSRKNADFYYRTTKSSKE
ncbi:unnamed protein product [Didymodactylos carnosus]|uniref:Uncharacterized protein n=1 Tax=Didymodactylos carnosus TaxID=1234261 RepID=A0A8S2VMR8_9BILA|nr:unnamed protein product [Didymodactylos carnosus]